MRTLFFAARIPAGEPKPMPVFEYGKDLRLDDAPLCIDDALCATTGVTYVECTCGECVASFD